MGLDVMVVLVALGILAALLAGVEPRPRGVRAPTPDDGAIGLGSGRSTRCPVCAEMALQLVGVAVAGGRDVPRVRCTSCRSSYVVRGTLGATGPVRSVPTQRHPSL